MITLKNKFLVAHFSPQTGGLIHLSTPDDSKSLVRASYGAYWEKHSDTWYGDATTKKDAKPFEVVSVDSSENHFQSVVRSPHVELTQRYELDPASPLLRLKTTLRGIGKDGELHVGGYPRVQFAGDIVDTFHEENQLFFDGAELGGGREIPCWRVFFRKGYREGLMIATRSKLAMTRFQILADGFDLRPNQHHNYSTALTHKPITITPTTRYQAEFELGPWTKARHDAILRAGKLNEPVAVGNPPPKGKAPRGLKGKVVRAVAFAPKAALGTGFDPKKWTVAKMPWAQGSKALFAAPGVKPPSLTLNPKLKGMYRIFVGVGNGAGIKMSVSGDTEATYRIAPQLSLGASDMSPAFMLFLSGKHEAQEADCGVAKMDGRKVRLERFPNRFTACVIDYVRFEKLTPAEVKRWEHEEATEPRLPLSGHSDIPDIAHVLDLDNPDPGAFRATIWEHARCKVRKIFWRIDGQCSDYPSKVNTMRYPLAKVHGVFEPQSIAYGRALKKVDMLRLAVDAAHKYGCQLYGWMRFNSYMGNVQSDFYKNNPQFWEEREYGRKGAKLCLAHPEVRKHKIDILVEAAGYGLDGLNLGFLRHPPVLLFAEILRKGYKQKYGVPPPRDLKHPDAHYQKSLPPTDPESVRWFQYRADFLTQFGRELRTALRAKNLGHVKIAIWIRPNHCLFDGIDMPAWLNEGLCDEVVSDFYCDSVNRPQLDMETPEWKKMVQSKVPLIRGTMFNAKLSRKFVPRILKGGYDGICTYESNQTCLDSEFIKLYRSLRK